MTNRNILLTLIFILFAASLVLDKSLGIPLVIISVISIVVLTVLDWIVMTRLEQDILIKFKIENRRSLVLKDYAFAIGVVIVAIILIEILGNVPITRLPNNTLELNHEMLYGFVIALNVSNILYQYRFRSCFLTSDGLFYSKDRKVVRLDHLDDYHYEPKYNSFILSKDGVETMELVAKTPIEPHEGVLIDWFEDQLSSNR